MNKTSISHLSTKKTKAQGNLYKQVIADLQTTPENILHIGDNHHSDYRMAKKYGLQAYHYKNKHSTSSISDKNNLVVSSIYQGLLKTNSSDSADFWYTFGYEKVGLLYYSFINWLIEKTKNDGIEKIAFLARDGYIMKEVYDILVKDNKEKIPAHYLYASRRALNLPSITTLDTLSLAFLIGWSKGLSIKQILQRIGINYKKYAQQVHNAGFKDASHIITDTSDKQKLRKLFISLEEAIRGKASQERDMLFRYLSQEKILDTKRLAFVDIGWHGSMQEAFNSLLKQQKINQEVFGYYLGLFDKAEVIAKKHKLTMHGYLCHFGKPYQHFDLIRLCIELFEFIHSAPHGSVINFKKEQERIVPQFADNETKDEKNKKAERLQEGALAFVQDLAKINNYYPVTIPRELAIQPLKKVLENPSLQEARELGDLSHADGFGNVYIKRFIAKPPTINEFFKTPRLLLTNYQRAFWKTGYIKRVCRYTNPGFFILKIKNNIKILLYTSIKILS